MHVASLIRYTNRIREKRRPKHPADLNFEWKFDAVPDNFIRPDVVVGNFRHIVLLCVQMSS